MTVYACDQFLESVVSPICQRCGQYKRYHVDRPGTGVKQGNSPSGSQIPPVPPPEPPQQLMRETLEWIASQQDLFFAECSLAEEIIARCKDALKVRAHQDDPHGVIVTGFPVAAHPHASVVEPDDICRFCGRHHD